MGVSDEIKIRILTDVAKAGKDLASLGISVGAVVIAFKKVISALSEMEQEYFAQEQAEAKLAAVIKSTGGAAGYTAGEMAKMAGEMQKVTVFGDDTVMTGQAVLATFTKIGRDVFPEAVKAAADMSTIMGQDLQSSIVQIGKALNDPIAGVTALQRVGVKLTDQQKDQIKAFVESGDVMSAQKVILQELQTEFGGAAVAMGDTAYGASVKLKNAFGELKEAQGEAVANGMRPFREWLTKLIEGFVSAQQQANALQKIIRGGFDAAGTNPIDVLYSALAETEKVIADNWGSIERAQQLVTRGAVGYVATIMDARRSTIEQIRNIERVNSMEKSTASDRAEAAAKALALAEYLQRVNEEYAKTDEAQLEALKAQISYWESILPNAVATKDEVEAILRGLRDQLPVAEAIVAVWDEVAGGPDGPPVMEAMQGIEQIVGPMTEIRDLLGQASEYWPIITENAEKTDAAMRDQYQTVRELGVETKTIADDWSGAAKAIGVASTVLEGNFLDSLKSIIGMMGPEGAFAAAVIDMFEKALSLGDDSWAESVTQGIEGIFADAILKDDWSGVEEALAAQIKQSVVSALMQSEVLKPYIDTFNRALKTWLVLGTEGAHDRMLEAYQNLINAGSQANDMMQELFDELPQMASGGIVTKPTVAMIGEAGPEAIVPLGRGGGLGTTIIINGSLIDARDLDSRIMAAVGRMGRGY